MQITFCNRWLLVTLLLVSTCILVTQGRRGGGGGSRGSSRGSSYSSRPSPSYSRPSPSYSRPSPSYSRPSPSYSRPAPAPAYRPSPRPAPAPAYKPSPSYARPAPAPAYKPSPRPASAPAYKPSPRPASKPEPPKSSEPIVVRQPASNPNFREPDHRQGSLDKQPAYNPNYKPDVGAPAGPPPPYSPSGHPVPNAPVGPPPQYSPNQQSGSLGNAHPGLQPPPYPGQPGVRPPAYPGQPVSYPSQFGSQAYPGQPSVNRPYPVQPGYPGSLPNQPGVNRPYPVQPGYPGSLPNQPGVNRPYPVQPGYPGSLPIQPGVNRPYPVQPGYPGSFPNQPGVNRPYPVQPGYPGSFPNQPGVNRPYPVQPSYPGGFYQQPGMNRPHPQQPLGGNVWQPHQGIPAPVYMNYGGLPTGTNMYTKPHKKKGFIGSLMSVGKPKHMKKNKYYGSYPSPYGVGGMGGMGGMNHMGGGFLGKHGKSAAMYTIFPYMAAKKAPKILKPRFGFMPLYMPRAHYHGFHHHHYHHRHHFHGDDDDNRELSSEFAEYFDIHDDDYIGKCQSPIKKQHSEMKCKTSYNEVLCDARCEEGYRFPRKIEIISNKCWHVTGVWRPQKNYPDCKPVCENGCLNGGECIKPGLCKCTPEYRGSRCQFSFLNCDVQKLLKGENVGWVCHHSKNESVCKISCKEPAQFESPPADEYKCTVDGVWNPNTIPHCVIKEKRDLESILLGE